MKKAFTLIELLVYMAIMGFVIVVAGRAFSDSTSMRVRTQNMTKATEEVNKTAAILKEDLSQMGAKSWEVVVSGLSTFKIAEKVYNSSTDSSSYNLDKSNSDFHKIDFKKVHYGEDGTCKAVLSITYGVDAKNNLYRKCEQLNDPECPNPPAIGKNECDSVAIAEDVQTFTLLPSKPASAFSFPSSSPTAPAFKLIDRGTYGSNFVALTTAPSDPSGTDTNTTVTLKGFRNALASENPKKLNQLLIADGNEASTSYASCHRFNFKKDEVYAIQFQTPGNSDSMSLFKPGFDHAAVGLRSFDGSSDGARVPGTTDFIFWPQQTFGGDIPSHYMEFSVPANAPNTCIAFEFALFSGAYQGTLSIRNFKVEQKNDKAYSFEKGYTFTDADKKDVKAFNLNLKIQKKGETGNTEVIIPTPNNGIKVKEASI